MNAIIPKTTRFGAVLALVAALLAFFARSAVAQETPAAPPRLSLGDAARLAARQTASVSSAKIRVDQARARVMQQRASLLPQLSADATASSHTLNSATFGFDFRQPGQPPALDPDGQIIGPVNLLDFRARGTAPIYNQSAIDRVRAARSGIVAASADVVSVAEGSAAMAATAYVRALRGAAQVQARVADSTLAYQLLSIARDQLAAGVGVALDVTRAETQLAGTRAQLIAARAERDRTRIDLLRALNLPFNTPMQLADSLGEFLSAPISTEDAAIGVALATRPDLRVLDQQLAVSNQQATAIRAERIPTVSLYGDQGQIGKGVDHLLPTYQVGLQVSVPVFEGFRRKGRVDEQTATSRDIEVRRRDLEQQIAADVRTAILDLGSSREQVAAAQERVRLAEQEVAQAEERFRAGVASNADVITASVTLNSARTQLVDALAAYQSSRVSLAKAQGTVMRLQ
jgi:outer membrane protein